MDGTATAEIAPASARLPERQRQVLMLHEQEGLSYDEIATRIGTTRDSVASLIAHAWINLYDELRGTVLASVSPSPECERCLGLIAARDDDELKAASAEGEWLEAHLDRCGRCRRAIEETREARAHFRSAGADARPAIRHRIALAAIALLLLVAGVATAMVRDDSQSTSADGGAQDASGAIPLKADAASAGRGKGAESQAGETQTAEIAAEAANPVPATVPAAGPIVGQPGREPSASPGPSHGQGAVEPPRRTAAPKPATPKPTAAAVPPPDPAPVTAPAETPPPEEAPPEHPGRAEPPGKPADRPPR
jgi:hypothetical protein